MSRAEAWIAGQTAGASSGCSVWSAVVAPTASTPASTPNSSAMRCAPQGEDGRPAASTPEGVQHRRRGRTDALEAISFGAQGGLGVAQRLDAVAGRQRLPLRHAGPGGTPSSRQPAASSWPGRIRKPPLPAAGRDPAQLPIFTAAIPRGA
jgi:hypothetical protein